MRHVSLLAPVAAALVALLVSAAAVAAQPADAGTLYRQFLEAQNRRDVAAQLALMTDDATIVSEVAGSLCTPTAGCVGRAAIRRELERRAAGGTQTSPPTSQVSGDTATNRIEVRNAATQRAGIERAILVTTVVARDGRIASIRALLDTTDPQTAGALAALRGQAAPAPAAAPAQIPRSPYGRSDAGWITLIDGTAGLENWDRVGDANWRAEDGAIVADAGAGGFLVSKDSYGDFQLRAEFWADETTNSGIYIRCSDPNEITASTSYEVNIYDQRPDPTYGTGAIVNVAAVSPMPTAGGKWNTYEITARGPQLTVVLNGVETASGQDGQFAQGSIALQYGSGPDNAPGGVIKWRKVQIKPL